MAQLQLEPVSTGKKNRARKAQLIIDMTPMVDLGFLLITFFIFTTTMSKPYETDLHMPVDTPVLISNIGESDVLTLVLSGKDSVYYYAGKWEEAAKNNNVRLTNYNIHNGIGDIVRKKQKIMGNRRDSLMLLIKPLESTLYENVMNALDEVLISDVKKYAIMDVTGEEKSWVAIHAK